MFNSSLMMQSKISAVNNQIEAVFKALDKINIDDDKRVKFSPVSGHQGMVISGVLPAHESISEHYNAFKERLGYELRKRGFDVFDMETRQKNLLYVGCSFKA